MTWSVSDMRRRDVYIDLRIREQTLSGVKKDSESILREPFKKAILYTNSAAKSEWLAEAIREWINEVNITNCHVVHVKGDQFRDLNIYYIKLFLGDSLDCQVQIGEKYYPWILAATSGSCNAGIDLDKEYLVSRDGFPPSTEDLLRELGRAGRRVTSFIVNINILSFIQSIKRIYKTHLIRLQKGKLP
jgi:hypothetical protein